MFSKSFLENQFKNNYSRSFNVNEFIELKLMIKIMPIKASKNVSISSNGRRGTFLFPPPPGPLPPPFPKRFPPPMAVQESIKVKQESTTISGESTTVQSNINPGKGSFKDKSSLFSY